MEVVRRQLSHPQDGLLAIFSDWSGVIFLLRLLHQGLLQAGNDLALRVDVLVTADGDAAAAQCVDVVFALVHEAADEPVVTEDDAGHLGDVLVALVLADVAAVVDQAGDQVAPPSLFLLALLDLEMFWVDGRGRFLAAAIGILAS